MDYRQARERIKRGEIHSLYLFSGPEEYLKEELLREILFVMEKKGKHFSREKVNADVLEKGIPGLIQGLRQATIQTSLLSEGRLLWVYNSPFFSPSKKDTSKKKEESPDGEKEILALVEDGFSHIILIFSVPQVDKRKKLVKVFEKAGRLIEFPVLKGVALQKWLTDCLAQEKLEAEEEAVLELLERAGENLTLLHNEIVKISTYLCGKKTVSAELVRRLVPGSSAGNIFQLTDAVGRRKMDEAIIQLTRILHNNEHPLVILAMIARHFRLLFQLRLLQDKNFSRREIIALLKIQPFILDKLQDQVKNYTSDSLARIISYLKETDKGIKSGLLEAGSALEQMILKLTTREEKFELNSCKNVNPHS